MVLPLFTKDFDALPTENSIVVLDGVEGKHAATVRRMRAGEGIQLTNGAGMRIVGEVVSAAEQRLEIRVSTATFEPKPTPELILIQALAKGDRDELAIQAATELGVAAVIPWQAERSISRWEGSKIAKGVERWQTIVTEAAKQALRVYTPVVELPVTTKQLVGLVSNFTSVLVLDPTAVERLSQTELPGAGSVAIVVGPEGGINEHELSVLQQAGAVRVRLGEEILRTSTAGMAAIAALQSRLNRW